MGEASDAFKIMFDLLFTYILKAGFLDGWLGLVMSVIADFYTFIILRPAASLKGN